MRKFDTLFLFGCFLLLAGLSSCGGSGKNEKEATQEEEAQAMEMKEEERASPLETSQGKVGGKTLMVQYGAPSVKGREIWGNLESYGEVWRTGANEATYIDISEDVSVEGKSLSAGKYSLFTIPVKEGDWTVIFNSDWNLEHGHYQYKEENDVLRVEVTPEWLEENQEQLKITVEEPGIVIRWEKLRLPIAIQ
ncbi:hypothetical protein DN752_05705 [Echinicola strongylocentroti]|uniref:DUF2911 domain-containing protein n=1 Tax=Echinicola strongylocentroti TaxID=1795355 RepID=A0A2Z4IFJ6_9BACT|nr:DUF2911 domain-containing protein [Echinicola strongylocentroti]AWW29655.1 hypothetical protein DN752_05705 [Echinicola strongylocentroti]